MSNATFSFSVLPPVLVPRQSEFPRPSGPMPYHMQHMSSVHGMPGNAGFPPSFQRPTPGPGMKFHTHLRNHFNLSQALFPIHIHRIKSFV